MSLWTRILARVGIVTRADLAKVESSFLHDLRALHEMHDRQIAALRNAIIKTAIHTPASNDVRGFILHPDRFSENDNVEQF